MPSSVAEGHLPSQGRGKLPWSWVLVCTLPWPPALVDEGSICRSDPEGCERGLEVLEERVPEEGPAAGLAGLHKQQGPCCSQKWFPTMTH